MHLALGGILAVTTAGFQGDILRLVVDSGPLVKIVLLVLLGFSVLSWSVIIERYRSLKQAEADSIRFLRELAGEKRLDRKSTRLNSSHGYISYAVFCLKKKKKE